MVSKEEDAFTCWICKGDGHKAGSRACPMFLSETVKRERFRWSFEDPMHNFVKEEEKKDKEKRVEELKSLLESSSSSEDEGDKRDHRKRKKKKKHKKVKKRKHEDCQEKDDPKYLGVKLKKDKKEHVKVDKTTSDSNCHRKIHHRHDKEHIDKHKNKRK